MDKEELKQLILEVLQEQSIASLSVPFHAHTQTDAGQLDGSKAILGAPQATIAAISGTPSSGGIGTLSNSDSALIASLKTAVNSLIATNKTLGFNKLS